MRCHHLTVLRRSAWVACLALVAASCAGSDDSTGDSSAPLTADTAASASDEPTETAAPDTAAPSDTEAPVETDAPAETDAPVETSAAADDTDIEFTAALGPYKVGVQTITVPDNAGGNRPLTVDVWFPIDQSIDIDAALHQYTLIEGTYYESPFALAATPDSIATDGPFPLVVYSHGSGGIRYIHSNYTEALASNGYIVVAPDHTGNTAADQLVGSEVDGAITAINRPNDVQRVIDAFLDPENPETAPYIPAVNPGQIAVTGHSFGGFTAYAMASGFSNANGEFVADERVNAIVALAPAAGPNLLTDELLASVDIPALVMAGTNDQTTPIDPNVTRPWELSASSPSYRVDLTAAEHETFTDLCAYQAFLPTLPGALPLVIETINARVESGCGAEDMPIERAQAITNTFAVMFLDSIFKGGDPLRAEQADEQPDLTFLVK